MHIMKLLKTLTSALKIQKQYFLQDKHGIATENLSIMQIAGAVGTAVSLIFFIIAPIIIPTWKVTSEYIFILPILIAAFLFSFFYSRRKKIIDPLTVEIASALFYILLTADFIAISVFPYPDTPQIFISLCFMFMPALMIQRPSVLLFIMGAAETVFIILASNYKTAFSLENDIFNTVASLFFSLIIMATANRLRCRNYAARMTLEKLSRTDALTGLLNKISFEKRAAAILSESGALYTFALIVLDIDDFKLANDTYGHPYGDRLLNEVGELLLGAFRKTDPVGRIGGDEFAELMCGSVDEALIEKKYEALKKRLDLISIDGIANHATCSVGAVIINQEYATYEELFRIADEALYQVKREGKSAIKIRIGV